MPISRNTANSTSVEATAGAQTELVTNPSPKATPTRSRSARNLQPAPGKSHGFSDETGRAIVAKKEPDAEAHIHPQLRAQPNAAPTASMMASSLPAPPTTTTTTSGAAVAAAAIAASMSPPPPHLMAAAPPAPMDAGPAPDGTTADGRKKRELSNSKRAAQNRAAQRAFRQRKEGYIKKLETQVRDLGQMEETIKNMQMENFALKEYVIQLQSRLLDVHGEYPPPPANVNLNQQQSMAEEEPPSSSGDNQVGQASASAGTPLEAVAQAVAGLAAQQQLAQQQLAERQQYSNEPGSAEEVAKLLQADAMRQS